MMVGRRVDDLYPRSARTPGEVVLSVRGLVGTAEAGGGVARAAARRGRGRRGHRGRRPHGIPAGGHGARPDSQRRGARGDARRLAAAERALAPGHGPGERGPQGRRARARSVDRREHHAAAAARLGAGVVRDARRAGPGQPAAHRATGDQVPLAAAAGVGACRAAISRRSPLRGCCTPIATCCSWTSRRVESTWARKRRSTG